MKFEEKLRLLIDQSPGVQSDVARRADIGQSSVNKYLHAKSRPDADRLLRLAKALGVTMDYLWDDEQERPPDSAISRLLDGLIRRDGEDRVRRLLEMIEEMGSGELAIDRLMKLGRRRGVKRPRQDAIDGISGPGGREPGTRPKGIVG